MKRRPPIARLHLIAGAHLDPVWLWEWEEGVAAALSTFRAAADFCDEFPEFVFTHNEAILYEWVEEHEPALFARIERLVRQGRWQIAGGWFLEPDCNMPSGESFVRQILYGRRYFADKFGARPTTAINVDPFGHSRGLVQILRGCGYDSYLFCRPGPKDKWFNLEADNFTWVGCDGSEITARRDPLFYNSFLGRAAEKVKTALRRYRDDATAMILWGVGNHGGGPSRQDLRAIARLAARERRRGTAVVHSTAEAYFAELHASRPPLPRRTLDVNPWAVGCYTSQVRIKQRHRQLENELYGTEKMLVAAALNGLLPWPRAELQSALHDLLFSEFHDILPGSSIQQVEEMALRLMAHGLEILSRLKARAFYRLAAGQPVAARGEYPVLVYNPHPFPVQATIECEMQLADQNWKNVRSVPTVRQRGRAVPAQNEKEASNINLDWRKRVVFAAELPPAQMTRFSVRFHEVRRERVPRLPRQGPHLVFRTAGVEIRINRRTGLVDRWRVDGIERVRPGAFCPVVFRDTDDAWGMEDTRFNERVGEFALMSANRSAAFANVRSLPAVRVIEDGPVRTVVEVVFAYRNSQLVQHYVCHKGTREFGVVVRVHWSEKARMLKLAVPLPDGFTAYRGQIAYGAHDLPVDGTECVAHKWVAAVDRARQRVLTCVNDGTYGSHFLEGTLHLSLLRSPAYSGHPIPRRRLVVADRNIPRIDQGERLFHFWFEAGGPERLDRVDREAAARNEKPFALSYFPSGAGTTAVPGVLLGDPVVQLGAAKISEDGGALVLRLFEPTGTARATTVTVPALGVETRLSLRGFEIRTLRVDLRTKRIVETNLLEETEPIPRARASTAPTGKNLL